METRKPKLKLIGQDGNAFLVLGLARRAADKAKWTREAWEQFKAKATSGGYENLLSTCCEYFEVR